jgi:ssDNA-binding Zn-finger/Zn-ribbon topoisomerase 1
MPAARNLASVEDVGLEEIVAPNMGYVCPKCSAAMVLKKAHTGRQFFGCEAFPVCKETRDADEKGNPLPSNFGTPRSSIELRTASIWERLMWEDDD